MTTNRQVPGRPAWLYVNEQRDENGVIVQIQRRGYTKPSATIAMPAKRADTLDETARDLIDLLVDSYGDLRQADALDARSN